MICQKKEFGNIKGFVLQPEIILRLYMSTKQNTKRKKYFQSPINIHNNYETLCNICINALDISSQSSQQTYYIGPYGHYNRRQSNDLNASAITICPLPWQVILG